MLNTDVSLSDLRDRDHSRRCVSKEEGQAFAKKLGLPYYETSALTMEGVKTVFDEAVSVQFTLSQVCRHTLA